MVGHYRIVSTVGTGGMGTVYRALDTRLNRPVALKAIADRRRDDVTALERLRREALAAAGLDHPYICKVYELVETDTQTLIAMEFVEGETLAARLRRGPLPVADAVHLAGEIAEGLANAHQHGLVHRDIKPANIMITPHGHVKLLDFGLARAAAPPGSPTQTGSGEAMRHAGTPPYMSPEQVLGQPVSPSSDLFSFGVVLYESLTGRQPFDDADAYGLAHHIVSTPPKALEAAAPHVPTALAKLVARCLAKRPADRPDSAGAVAEELRRLQIPAAPASKVRAVAVAAILVAVAAAAVAWAVREWRAGDRVIALSEQQVFVGWPSEESESRFSPDGRLVSFLSESAGGERRLFVQAVAGGAAQQVVVPEGEVLSHAWSPDGAELACAVRLRGSIVVSVVPAPFGGAARALPDVKGPFETLRLVRWAGADLYLETQETGDRHVVLKRLNISTGVLGDVSTAWAVPGTLRGVDVTPDGRRVAYAMLLDGQEDLWAAAIDGSAPKQLTNDAFFNRFPVWTNDDRTVLYQSNRSGQVDVWGVTASSGRSWQITSSQTEERPDSVSADGSILTYEQYSSTANLWMLDVSTRDAVQLSAGALSDYSASTAGAGGTVVFQRGASVGAAQLMVGILSGSAFRSPPEALVTGFSPKVSPDGRWLAYLATPAGSRLPSLHVMNLATGQDAVVSKDVRNPGYSLVPPVDWAEQTFAWSADSGELWFIERTPAGPALRRYRHAGGVDKEVRAQVKAPGTMRDIYPSPDGRRVAYVKVLPGPQGGPVSELHVVDLASGGDRTAYASAGGGLAWLCRGWTAGGRSVILVRRTAAARDLAERLEVFEVSVGRRAPAAPLIIERGFVQTLRVDPDARVIYVTRSDAGVHNLYSVPLDGRAPRPLSSNQMTGISFSGVVRAAGGDLIFTRDERKRDIYISRIDR